MGEIKLPIPVVNGKVYKEVTTKEFNAGIIADTKKVIDNGDPYRAIQVFITGCIESIGEMTEKANIKQLIGSIPYKSAEYISVKIILEDEPDHKIEGIYSCPRCGTQKVCEKTGDVDTRDNIDDLEVAYSESETNNLKIELENTITVPANEDEISDVSEIEIEHPTLKDCSTAIAKIGENDKIRLQLAIYLEALKKVNDYEIDNKWKNRYGMILFEQMGRKDLRKIGEAVNKFGLNNEVEKKCIKCGKEFKAPLNTSNFFDSALQSVEI